jgi:hypothetical protein
MPDFSRFGQGLLNILGSKEEGSSDEPAGTDHRQPQPSGKSPELNFPGLFTPPPVATPETPAAPAANLQLQVPAPAAVPEATTGLSREESAYLESVITELAQEARVTASGGYGTFYEMLKRMRVVDPSTKPTVAAAAALVKPQDLVAEVAGFEANLNTAYQAKLNGLDADHQTSISSLRQQVETQNGLAQNLDEQIRSMEQRITELRKQSAEARANAGQLNGQVALEQTKLGRRKLVLSMAQRRVANDLSLERSQFSV